VAIVTQEMGIECVPLSLRSTHHVALNPPAITTMAQRKTNKQGGCHEDATRT
jgi:hypothetical protein